ncbi:MAG: SDR family oxidoreductase [Gemmatimonadota bacterium]|nr:MAG: SDR family oxidoreductase [Gemmatimonadota bacterium]
MTEFREKNVLISGAASGIGRLLAEKIAAEGARVILWDIDEEALAEVTREIEGRGHKASPYRCDVSNKGAIEATANRVLKEHGPVDIVINNAGIVTGKPILEAEDAEIRRTFDINTLAHFWTVRAFLPAMLERGAGHIVTVASAAGLAAAPRLTDYSASKFAAVGFDEALRLELARGGHDIRTTVVCPFYVNTGMFEGVKTRFPWILPILDPEYVASRIVKAIRKNRRRLLMPRFVYAALPLRILPVSWFDALIGFLGVSRSMDEFTGSRSERHPK